MPADYSTTPALLDRGSVVHAIDGSVEPRWRLQNERYTEDVPYDSLAPQPTHAQVFLQQLHDVADGRAPLMTDDIVAVDPDAPGIAWDRLRRITDGTVDVRYERGGFIARMNDGREAISPDGVTWTVRDDPRALGVTEPAPSFFEQIREQWRRLRDDEREGMILPVRDRVAFDLHSIESVPLTPPPTPVVSINVPLTDTSSRAPEVIAGVTHVHLDDRVNVGDYLRADGAGHYVRSTLDDARTVGVALDAGGVGDRIRMVRW